MSLIKKKNSPMPTSARSSVTHVSKKKELKKPAWDATNSNLEVLKPTHEELERRKVAVQSKNMDQIRQEKQRQSILKAKKGPQTQLDSKTQLALLKEILYDDEQLKKLLLKSDSTIKNASNLYDSELNGIQTKKSARISVTLAPNASANESNLPIASKNKKTNAKNLNTSSSSSDDDDLNLKLENQEINNLVRYRQLLLEKQQALEAQKKAQIKMDKLNTTSLQDFKKYFKADPSEDLIMKMMSENEMDAKTNHPSIKTDTSKMNRILSQTQIDTNDLKYILNELDDQLIDYEESTGRKQTTSTRLSSSNYTVALVSVVSSLLRHLKHTTLELKAEREKLNETTKQLDIHRKLIDGLTSEIYTVKTQNEKILSEFANYEAKTETELDQIKMMLKSYGIVTSTTQRSLTSSRKLVSPAPSQHSNHDFSSNNELDRFSERLNAMLQTDIVPGTITQSSAQHLLKSSSQPTMSNGQQQQHEHLNRMVHIQASKQKINDYNSQINELSARNFEAQQKLRSLQQQQQFNEQVESEFQLKFPETMQHFDSYGSQTPYSKLKEDQQTLKEQIMLLNKQRELAQKEMHVIANNGNATVATLTTLGLGASNGYNRSSPNLSPIPTEMNHA